mmetsp:Transcript_5762/g.18123  ORF Transcript_5762/g.18123 Transcript_5762/m.18123 type:complete len:105 (+) Transcript_5762:1218-1532(+)
MAVARRIGAESRRWPRRTSGHLTAAAREYCHLTGRDALKLRGDVTQPRFLQRRSAGQCPLAFDPLAYLVRVGQTLDAASKTIMSTIEWKPPAIIEQVPLDQLPF